jgi:hypothetical protein
MAGSPPRIKVNASRWIFLSRNTRVFNDVLTHKPHFGILDASKSKFLSFRLYPMTFSRMRMFRNDKAFKRIFEDEQPFILNTHGSADSKPALSAARKAEVPGCILAVTPTVPFGTTGSAGCCAKCRYNLN